MNFEQALVFSGINPRKPVYMSERQFERYGFIIKNQLLHWEFYGILKNRVTQSIEYIPGGMFGSSLEPDIQDDETLRTLQRQNPFIGTTHYPDLAMSMVNISRAKLFWFILKDIAGIAWKMLGVVMYVARNVVKL